VEGGCREKGEVAKKSQSESNLQKIRTTRRWFRYNVDALSVRFQDEPGIALQSGLRGIIFKIAQDINPDSKLEFR